MLAISAPIRSAEPGGKLIKLQQKHLTRWLTALGVFVLPISLVGENGYAQTDNLVNQQEIDRQARHFLSLIDEATNFAEDQLINDYLSRLAAKLAANGEISTKSLHYFLIADKSINAFAGPGATFFLNTGLIGLSKTEGELASVLAHELAHYKQKHLSRLFDKQRKSQVPSMLGALAGIVIGGPAGIAAMSGSIAAQMETIIDYTLTLEREADAVGLDILVKAGYDPIHTKNFLLSLEKSIREQGQFQSNIHNTHPITPERIANLEARIRNFGQTLPESDTFEFLLVKARTRVLYDWASNKTYKYFEDNLSIGTEQEKIANRYGYALSLAKDGNYSEARNQINALRSLQPDNLWFALAMTDFEFKAQSPEVVLQILEGVVDSTDASFAVIEAYTLALVRSNRAEEAEIFMRKQIRLHPKAWSLRHLHAVAANKSGDTVNAYLSESESQFLRGNLGSALQQLRVAETKTDDFYFTETIREKKRIIKAELEWRSN